MQTVSSTFSNIVAGDYQTEVRVFVNDVSYGMSKLVELHISKKLFDGDTFSVGGCVAGEIDLQIFNPATSIPKMAKIEPQVRVKNADSTSEWIPQGIFYIDTRSYDIESDVLTIHGYDDLAKLSCEYSEVAAISPADDISAVNDICDYCGITFDNPSDLNRGYEMPSPVISEDRQKSAHEVMCEIASAYAGNWTMTADGKLRLVVMSTLPTETYLLVTENGDGIVFGSDRIRVG